MTLNHFEAGLWSVIGLIFAVAGIRTMGTTSSRCYLLAVLFVAFGISDLVESETGGWWQPWWLLVWKAACLTVFAWQLWEYGASKRHEEWAYYATGMKFYLIGGTLHAAIITLFVKVGAWYWLFRLAWALSPWSSFPFPYGSGDLVFYSYGHDDALATQIERFISSVVSISIPIAVVHSLTFLLVAWGYKLFGSPNYWLDIRTKLKFRKAWSDSARRSWWVWPAVLIIENIWTYLASGFMYTMYPIVNMSYPFQIAIFVIIPFSYISTHATVLRKHIIAVVGTEEVRCISCGYLLRGLLSKRCPECGHNTLSDSVVDFRFRWEWSRNWSSCWKKLRIAMLLGLAFSPLWVSFILVRCPQQWMQFVPSVIQPGKPVFVPNQDIFPIRLDAVCIIQCDESLAVLVLNKMGPSSAKYAVGYWEEASDYGTQTPDTIQSGSVMYSGGPILPIGPWKFKYGIAWEHMLWLTRPTTTCSVTATSKDDYDGDLTWVPNDEESDDLP